MSKHFKEVFERDNRRCVYCCRDLMRDFEVFMIIVEDHLIPKSAGGPDEPQNIVTACSVCNILKGDFRPDWLPNLDDPKSRREYIKEIRAHIMGRRADRMADFATWTHPE